MQRVFTCSGKDKLIFRGIGKGYGAVFFGYVFDIVAVAHTKVIVFAVKLLAIILNIRIILHIGRQRIERISECHIGMVFAGLAKDYADRVQLLSVQEFKGPFPLLLKNGGRLVVGVFCVTAGAYAVLVIVTESRTLNSAAGTLLRLGAGCGGKAVRVCGFAFG